MSEKTGSQIVYDQDKARFMAEAEDGQRTSALKRKKLSATIGKTLLRSPDSRRVDVHSAIGSDHGDQTYDSIQASQLFDGYSVAANPLAAFGETVSRKQALKIQRMLEEDASHREKIAERDGEKASLEY